MRKYESVYNGRHCWEQRGLFLTNVKIICCIRNHTMPHQVIAVLMNIKIFKCSIIHIELYIFFCQKIFFYAYGKWYPDGSAVIRCLVADLSPRWNGFDSRWIHLGLTEDREALGQAFLRVLRFSLSVPMSNPPYSYTLLSQTLRSWQLRRMTQHVGTVIFTLCSWARILASAGGVCSPL